MRNFILVLIGILIILAVDSNAQWVLPDRIESSIDPDSTLRYDIDSLLSRASDLSDSVLVLELFRLDQIDTNLVYRTTLDSLGVRITTNETRISELSDSTQTNTDSVAVLSARSLANLDSINNSLRPDILQNAIDNAVQDDTLFQHNLRLLATEDSLKRAVYKDKWTNQGTYDFDGVNDYIEIADDASLNFGTGDFSISFWFKYTGDNGCLFGKRDGNSGYQVLLSAGRLDLFLGDGTNILFSQTSNTLLTSGEWYYIQWDADRVNDELKYYINSELDKTIDISSITGSVLNSANLFIADNGSGTGYVETELSQPLIFNKSLSQDEVTQLYNQGLGVDELPNDLRANAVLDLPHRTATESRWTDLSGYGNDGIVNGATLLSQEREKLASQDVLFSDAWSLPDGGVMLDGVGYYTALHDNKYNFGTGEFQIDLGVSFDLDNIDIADAIIRKYSSNLGFLFDFASTTQLNFRIGSAANTMTLSELGITESNKTYYISIFRSGDNATISVNNKLKKTLTGYLNENATNASENMYLGYGGISGREFGGGISYVRLNNTYIDYWNNGLPHLAVTPPEYQGASNTTLINGEVLTVNKNYRILNVGTPTTDFTSYGSADNNYGTEFILSSALTLSTNDSLVMAGEIDHFANNMVNTNGWLSNYGTIANSSGSPTPLGNRPRDSRSTISADYTLTSTVQQSALLKYIKIVNNTSTSQDIDIGTTAGGVDVVNNLTIAGNSFEIVDDPLIRLFSDSSDQTLYIDDGTSGWVSNVDIIFYYEPLGVK
jgi:hypothetical protein